MKKTLLWILAIIITLGSAFYQRTTGPTYPKKIEINLGNNLYSFKLPTSGETKTDQLISVPVTDTSISVILNYRHFPVNETYANLELQKAEDGLSTFLPEQPPAGKLEYFLTFKDHKTDQTVSTEHIVIRFKGHVPSWALIPHIFLMFFAMLLSNLAGLFAIGKVDEHVLYGKLTLLFLLLGGMFLGPVVQHYAFGQAWTGIPFGWDLTDNKTLIAVIFWLVAVLGNRKNPKYRYTIIASIILFLIYMIPHSMFGSELDYSSGEVVTGFIQTLIG